VYLTFEREAIGMGTIVIELFRSLLPKTCENFRLLCTGENSGGGHYLRTPIR
jgi:cyclophilin family peptidyl-prolyl cis-trans isomerase